MEGYDRLLAIMSLQQSIVENDTYTIDWYQFGVLSLEFSSSASRVETILSQLGGYNQLDLNEQTSIETRLKEMIDMGQLIENKMNEKYTADSSTMLQVKTQQTALRSYGGVNYSDSIALYIDQRK